MRLNNGLTALVALMLVGSLLAIGGVAADEIHTGDVSLDDPDNEQIEVDVAFSGNTDATVELVRDGSVVADDNVDGADGDTLTAIIDTTGVSSGDAELRVETPDGEGDLAEIEETRMLIELEDHIELDQAEETNETADIVTDVEFNADEMSTAHIELIDHDTGDLIEEETLQFDPIAHEDGSGINSSDMTVDLDDQDQTNVTAQITVDPAESYVAVWSEEDSSVVGTFAGIESDTRLAVIAGAVIVGLLYARSREMI